MHTGTSRSGARASARLEAFVAIIAVCVVAMAFNGTVEFFVDNVFNYPTLAEAYKVAALNGLNKV